MSERLTALIHENRLPLPEVCAWDRDRPGKGPSNTHRELLNILLLAFERSIHRVSVVTVSVHVPRIVLFTRSIVEKNSGLGHIEVSFVASEQVLVEACPSKYAPRALALYASQAYTRTAFYERRGSIAFLEDRY